MWMKMRRGLVGKTLCCRLEVVSVFELGVIFVVLAFLADNLSALLIYIRDQTLIDVVRDLFKTRPFSSYAQAHQYSYALNGHPCCFFAFLHGNCISLLTVEYTFRFYNVNATVFPERPLPRIMPAICGVPDCKYYVPGDGVGNSSS